MDLGVSSPQLDEADRGFSHRSAAPLDMRMDRRGAVRATDVVNGYSFARLRRVISELGEERYADRVARRIIDARPIQDTGHLAEVVASAIPAPARRERWPSGRTYLPGDTHRGEPGARRTGRGARCRPRRARPRRADVRAFLSQPGGPDGQAGVPLRCDRWLRLPGGSRVRLWCHPHGPAVEARCLEGL
ncbi:MAG: 16S rRNA (cytosine(1402)-N(4))-methyltransferase [Microthrixaceae bacterium]|nr:16S rRNA (cytosine(1402)-N(4))-methyltransferase [Microthrixaceae bacterium]